MVSLMRPRVRPRNRTSSVLRPRVRIPLSAAVGIPAVAYILRAALRGWNFAPDLPADAILGIVLSVFVASAWWIRRSAATKEPGGELPPEVHDEYGSEGDKR